MSASGISTSALHASGGGLQKYEMSMNNTTVVDDEKYQSKNSRYLTLSFSLADTWGSETATLVETDEHDIEAESQHKRIT
jgi:hypothetical protein